MQPRRHWGFLVDKTSTAPRFLQANPRPAGLKSLKASDVPSIWHGLARLVHKRLPGGLPVRQKHQESSGNAERTDPEKSKPRDQK